MTIGTLQDLNDATAAGFAAVGDAMALKVDDGSINVLLSTYGGGAGKTTAQNNAALLAAVTQAAANGGDMVDVGSGNIDFSTTIDLTGKHGVRLVSRGRGQGSYGLLKARLRWFGAAGQPMLKCDAIATPTIGIGWEGIELDGRGIASHCAKLACVGAVVVSDYRLLGATSKQLLITGSAAVVYDNQRGTFERGQIIASGAADGVQIENIAGVGQNTNNFAFRDTDIFHEQGRGFDYGGADSNSFENLNITSTAVAASGIGLYLRAGAGAAAGRGLVASMVQVNGGEVGRTNFIVEQDDATPANRPSSNILWPLLTMNGGGIVTRCTASTMLVVDDNEIMDRLRQVVFRDETAAPFAQLYRMGASAYVGSGAGIEGGWNANGLFKGADPTDLLTGVKSDFGPATSANIAVTTAAGAATTATCVRRSKQIGKYVYVQYRITPDGSGDGTYRVALPTAMAATGDANFTGRNTLTGKQLQGVSINTTDILAKNYDDTAPGVTAGGVLRLSGWYEAA